MSTVPDRQHAIIVAALARIEGRLDAIERRLDRHDGPRDGADRALFEALAAISVGRSFTSREIFEHAAVAPALREAIEAADIDNPRQLGRLLRRMRGHGLVRVEASREGIRWRCEFRECETRKHAPA